MTDMIDSNGTVEELSEREQLMRYGTKAFVLKPSAILAAAVEDLNRFARNAARADGFEVYAFHRKHVRKATCANHLIELALAEIEIGKASGKHWTRVIYNDVELLAQARGAA